jgi:hypothetical protein
VVGSTSGAGKKLKAEVLREHTSTGRATKGVQRMVSLVLLVGLDGRRYVYDQHTPH